MGGIVIDIWEKSNLFRSFGSQKGAKNGIFVQGGGALKAPSLMVGLSLSTLIKLRLDTYNCYISFNPSVIHSSNGV